VSCLLAILAGAIAIAVAVFVIEILAAIILPRRSFDTALEYRGRIAVLVPAHNESAGLRPTLADIRSQLRPGDRVLVVADNCSDDTAEVASAAGAEVIERHDRDHIGKGYALAFGIAHLRSAPPDVVVMIDADCRLSDLEIGKLASACSITQRPIQALYLMVAPPGREINHQVAEFAWRIKNWVRPLGLSTLGLPCQLMGTGMAFPWHVIRSAHLAEGWIVEDLKLGLDLALAGAPALFCPSACVTSEFPSSATAANTQRQRWEQGQLTMMLAVPRLILTAIAQRNWSLLALALDLTVPPLALLVILVTSMLAVSAFATLVGASTPLALFISLTSFLALFFSLFVSWFAYGREALPIGATFLAIMYVVRKLRFYRHILSGKAVSKWIRTSRE